MQLGPLKAFGETDTPMEHQKTNERGKTPSWSSITENYGINSSHFHTLWKEQSLCSDEEPKRTLGYVPFIVFLAHCDHSHFKSWIVFSSKKPVLASHFLSIYALLWLISKLTCILWLEYKTKTVRALSELDGIGEWGGENWFTDYL